MNHYKVLSLEFPINIELHRDFYKKKKNIKLSLATDNYEVRLKLSLILRILPYLTEYLCTSKSWRENFDFSTNWILFDNANHRNTIKLASDRIRRGKEA